MDLTNYKKAIHPDCGKKVDVYKDILITPFYTEKFCDDLVELAKFYNNKFEQFIKYQRKEITEEITDTSPWNTLFFSRISNLLFEDFCNHYKRYITPVLEKQFASSGVDGWFSPFIIKYDKPGQIVHLHNDISSFTMNVKLNTDFEGCDLEFPRQGWSNKNIPKGSCFIWPSTITHPHQSKPLIKGTKYTLASWTHPVSWNPKDTGGSMYSKDINDINT